MTSSGPDINSVTVSMSFNLASGGSLTAMSTSVSFSADNLSGNMNVTGGSGPFAKATGTFSFNFAVPPGTTAAFVAFTLTGSGNLNNVVPPSTSIQLPDATVGVPYSADISQGLGTSAAGASFQLSAGANPPAGLTLSSSGLLSGTPTQAAANSMFNVDLVKGTGTAGTLVVTLNVLANSGPAVGVKPGNLSFSLTQGSTAVVTQSAVIGNGGTAQTFTATATANSGGNWLSVSPASGTVAPFTSASVSVNVDPSKFNVVGTFSGTVSISLSPANQQFDIGVLVTVNSGQAQLQISQSGLRFRTLEGGAAPPSQSIAILNGGKGT
jgi:hypothetical protein